MGIVFDEVVAEIHTPSTETTPSVETASEGATTDRLASEADLHQHLERLMQRQLRLMAD